MPDQTDETIKENDPKQVQDLEVKDAQIIFSSVWSSLETELGEEYLRFPKEIFWLNGAPGAGKGTNTDFIMQYRDLTAPPLVVSSLLQSPEAEKMKDAGMLVGDREVIEIMLRKLLDPVYKSGAVVDGFPRTKVQVECVKLLFTKLVELRNKYRDTLYSEHFKKPHFHIVVLFVDEKESVRRQLNRGVQAQAHNNEVKESGVGELIDLRATDLNPEAALNRYRTFKEKTYGALKDLREIFFYHFINAHGPVEEVRARIDKELRYQGSLELDEATYDLLSRIPVASSLSKHARQDLVDRLDSYQQRQSELFEKVIALIQLDFMPIIMRHAISGMSVVNTESTVLHDPDALSMMIDIFSERGYHAIIDLQREEVPESIDPKTFKIKTRIKRIYRVRVQYKGSDIRRGR
ncbi:MAG: nucleoside monophosphate kinase [Opitutales bacterium]|jgi:adenylate kinase|nr:nucleoside monophosphate kinase [Opitutales bacterium]MDP4643104.1 nucleoside monophosphate kinase [Opitutales bacterium]MDP4776349.1 nucleoside monophosphate kinase [Opitutales bacterium]MDP4884678.1 nucleoside monophosphate kinase [Opitutales bacterium]MDP5080679.1 nucleoside monophosphate kinase [Opitutales bacterium]